MTPTTASQPAADLALHGQDLLDHLARNESEYRPGDRFSMRMAANAMLARDARQLCGWINSGDTWLRERVLDYVHPTLWAGLGYRPVCLERALHEYEQRFHGVAAAVPPAVGDQVLCTRDGANIAVTITGSGIREGTVAYLHDRGGWGFAWDFQPLPEPEEAPAAGPAPR